MSEPDGSNSDARERLAVLLERNLETVTLRRSLADAQVSLAVLLGIGLPQTTLIFPDQEQAKR